MKNNKSVYKPYNWCLNLKDREQADFLDQAQLLIQ